MTESVTETIARMARRSGLPVRVQQSTGLAPARSRCHSLGTAARLQQQGKGIKATQESA